MGGVGGEPGRATVRPLEPADIPYAVDLAQQEGWAFDEEDFQRLLPLGGGQVVEVGGEPAGFLTSTVYGPVAWVGNVIVEPAHRNRGLGTTLLEATLDALRDEGVETVRLYAVERAVSLYERAGFVAEGRAASLHGRGAREDPAAYDLDPLRPGDVPEVAAWDAERFGSHRGDLLERLVGTWPDAAFLLRDGEGELRGYVVAKPADADPGPEHLGTRSPATSELGPAVTRAGDREAVKRLLNAGLAAVGPRPCEVGVRGENPLAREHLDRRGFRQAFPAVTMRWGRDAHEGRPGTVAAVGGMEKG